MKGNRSDQQKRGHWGKDRSERGIYLRGKMWYIRYRDQQGKTRVERVGPSKALALKVYAKRKTEVHERRFFPATGVRFEQIVDDTIAIARKDFTAKYPDKKFKAGNYEIVKKWFFGRAADSITTSEIHAKLSNHTQVPATFNRFRVAISHAYKIAVEVTKKLSTNPGKLVKMKDENNERTRYLNQFSQKGKKSEETRMREALRKLFREKEPEIDLALNTGMRWSEQYRLKWQHVDLTRNIITIILPKGGKNQTIPINAEARRALLKLEMLAGKSEFVCPANDYDKHRDWCLAVWNEAGIDDFHWHDLRHTFASRLVMNGVDIYTVGRLMRHKNLQVTMRYAHLSDQHLEDAISKLVPTGDTSSDTVPAQNSTGQRYLQ